MIKAICAPAGFGVGVVQRFTPAILTSVTFAAGGLTQWGPATSGTATGQFTSSDLVYINGTVTSTTFINATTLTFALTDPQTVSTSALRNSGTQTVVVKRGSISSAGATFSVTARTWTTLTGLVRFDPSVSLSLSGTGATLWQDAGSVGFNVRQGTTAARPGTLTSATYSNRLFTDWDGTDDFMSSVSGTSVLASLWMTNAAYWSIGAFIMDTMDQPAGNFNYEPFWLTSGGYQIAAFRAGPQIFNYNYDGTDDINNGATFSTGSLIVGQWSRSGGTMSDRINLGTSATAASGNTDAGWVNDIFHLGGISGGTSPRFFDGKLGVWGITKTVPSSDNADAAVREIYAYYYG